jgi:hypothetical protein
MTLVVTLHSGRCQNRCQKPRCWSGKGRDGVWQRVTTARGGEIRGGGTKTRLVVQIDL